MKDVDIPARFGTVFASQQIAPYIRDVPDAPGAPGAASLQKGFPGPACFTPPTAGGIPPFGQDFNGLLKRVTAWSQWQAAGAPAFFDSTFATSIGGYPSGAVLMSSTVPGLSWRSTVDDNTTNPDSNLAANWVQVSRIPLTTAATFYINGSTGSDTTGIGTAGLPWQTPQFAVNYVQQRYDLRGYKITFQLADYVASYGDVAIIGGFVGLTNYSQLVIQGNVATPANTKVGNISFQQAGSQGLVQHVTLVGTYGISAGELGFAAVGDSCVFTGMAGYHLDCRQNGIIYISGNYSITGGAAAHLSALAGGTIIFAGGLAITVSGTPGFGAFAVFDGASKIICSAPSPFSGAATGTRYSGSALSLCNGTGSDANYFPGNSVGVLATDARYL